MGNVPCSKQMLMYLHELIVSLAARGLSYSSHDDGTETGQQTIFKNDTTHNSYVTVNHDASIITFNKHAHSSNIIINNSSIAPAIMHGFQLTTKKINLIIFFSLSKQQILILLNFI